MALGAEASSGQGKKQGVSKEATGKQVPGAGLHSWEGEAWELENF